MGGMGFGQVKKSAERIERLTEYHDNKDRYRRAQQIVRRLQIIEQEHDALTHELYGLVPEMFRGGAGGPIHPPGDAVADISDYCPDYDPR